MRRLIFILCFVIALTGCGKNTPLMQKYEAQYFDVFDTVTTITVYAESREKADEYFNAVHRELLRLHKLFDPYNNYDGVTNLKTINDNAGNGDFMYPNFDLNAAILCGRDAYEQTDGAINIAMGETFELWHRYRDNALENGNIAVPSKEELEATREFDDITSVKITHDGVKVAKKGVSLNLGSIAKGYAADNAKMILKRMGCDSALINLGGNVVCYRGSAKPEPWKIGVQSATDPDGIIDVVETDNGSLVSSGDYQRYYEYEGKRYHHIIDPETLMPAAGKRGTTVVCGDDVSCADADMLSTALFILPGDKADELAKRYNVKQVYYTDENGNVDTLYK